MPRLGAASLVQYRTLHPDLQRVADEAIKHYDFAIVEGFRNEKAQNIAYASGASQRKWPFGEHNKLPSDAMDCYPWPIDWSDTPKNVERQTLLAGIMLATSWQLGIQLRWGGDWNRDGDTRDEKFRDRGHFERWLAK
jgi:peptidoglycan L-alanyl-D-glutamate endopeptidase CwlK